MHAINSGCLARGFMRPMIFLPRDLLASDVHGQEKRAFWVSASNVLDKTIPFDDDLDAPNENNIRFRCSLLRAVLMSHSLKVVRGLILRDRFLWWPPAKRHPNSQDKLGGPLDWTHIAKYAPRQSFKKLHEEHQPCSCKFPGILDSCTWNTSCTFREEQSFLSLLPLTTLTLTLLSVALVRLYKKHRCQARKRETK